MTRGTNMRTSNRSSGERGSIPLTIVAAIILGGIVVALFATTTRGVESARRDRDWHQAIQVADAGIQQAYVVLADLQPEEEIASCDDNGDRICSGVLNDGSTYEWTYDRIGPFLWDVQSIGEFGGSERAVHAEVGQQPLVDVAIITRRRFTYNGAGEGNDPFGVGTFDEAIINGTPAINSLAQITLFGQGPHYVNIPPETVPQETAAAPSLLNIALQAFDEGGVCQGQPYYPVYPRDVPNPHERGQIYCVGKVDFGNDVHELTGPSDLEVVIFVDPNGPTAVTMAGNGSVNWASPRDASQLQLYVGGGDVTVGGNSRIAATIWAPASACTTNGGTVVAGAMVCNTATLNGNLAYDPRVEEIPGTEFKISGWREEYVRD
jgi:hypothetical protein